MGELRVIHFADLHLGVESGGRPNPDDGLNQRIHDVCDRLDELCDVAEAEGVHAVLFAGDAFKNQHPSPTLQNLFARRIRRLARSGAAVFLLVGNHDLPRSAGLAHPFSIYDALETDGVVVGDRAQIYPLALAGDAPAPVLHVAALPHFSRHQVLAQLGTDFDGDIDEVIAAQFRRTLDALRGGVDPNVPTVFVGHCHVQQADAGTTRDLFGVSDVEISIGELLTPAAFPYYALGHLHKRQVLSDEPFAAYAGSLERIDFGEGERTDVAPNGSITRTEAEPKGFFRFDLVEDNGSWQLADAPGFREVHARPFVTLRVGDLGAEDPIDDLEERIRAARKADIRFDDAFVKIMGRTVSADRQRVTRGSVRAFIPEAYDVRVALDAVDEQSPARDPRFAVPMSEYEALTKYLETRDDWSDDRDELMRLGRELIDEVLS
jgi:exonuclease SbcD